MKNSKDSLAGASDFSNKLFNQTHTLTDAHTHTHLTTNILRNNNYSFHMNAQHTTFTNVCANRVTMVRHGFRLSQDGAADGNQISRYVRDIRATFFS